MALTNGAGGPTDVGQWTICAHPPAVVAVAVRTGADAKPEDGIYFVGLEAGATCRRASHSLQLRDGAGGGGGAALRSVR